MILLFGFWRHIGTCTDGSLSRFKMDNAGLPICAPNYAILEMAIKATAAISIINEKTFKELRIVKMRIIHAFDDDLFILCVPIYCC